MDSIGSPLPPLNHAAKKMLFPYVFFFFMYLKKIFIAVKFSLKRVILESRGSIQIPIKTNGFNNYCNMYLTGSQ